MPSTLYAVMEDLIRRSDLGMKKYGHAIEESPDDMLQHAYEEALDLAMYLKTEINRKASDNLDKVTFNKYTSSYF